MKHWLKYILKNLWNGVFEIKIDNHINRSIYIIKTKSGIHLEGFQYDLDRHTMSCAELKQTWDNEWRQIETDNHFAFKSCLVFVKKIIVSETNWLAVGWLKSWMAS